jgi:hypothetical protein
MVIDLEQALAFRLESQYLARRLPHGSLFEAAGACGIQNTPPGSAELALHARVSNLIPDDIERAVAIDKTLLQMWSLRGAPYLFPTGEAEVFTLGLLPQDEQSLRFFILGIEQALPVIEMNATEIVSLTEDAVRSVLDQRILTNKRQLDIELAAQIAQWLPPDKLAAWHSLSMYGPNQQLGEALVSFALRPLSLQGLICFTPRRGSEASFARTDFWLGAPLPEGDPDRAQVELARRYLHCYGPSTLKHFAEWAGISVSQAGHAWKRVEGELVEVVFSGRKTWLLQQDLSRFDSPQPAEGVRFLPPHDPYLLLRDRASLIPDPTLQRRIWRQAGNPGVVLVNGKAAGTWQPKKTGSQLKIRVGPFMPLSSDIRSKIETEAETLGNFRKCNSVVVAFIDGTHG